MVRNENETRIREAKEGRIQEAGSVMIIAYKGETPEDTLIYLPRYKANPKKKISEDDLGLLSETMRMDGSRREAPLQASLRGFWEEINDDLSSKKLLIQPGKVYSKMLFDTSKGWDTKVTHVQGYLSVFWAFDKSQFPVHIDTDEMKGAEWVTVREIVELGLQDGFRQSPPSPQPVIGRLFNEGFFNPQPECFQQVDWFKKINTIDQSGK